MLLKQLSSLQQLMAFDDNIINNFVLRVGSGDVTTDTSGPLLFPAPAPPPPQPPLQNVETFGSFLGEEIVANWRRSLERTILSQGSAPQHLARVGLPPPEHPGRSSSTGSVARSPVSATPPPPHTPTQPLDHSQPDDTGNSTSFNYKWSSFSWRVWEFQN